MKKTSRALLSVMLLLNVASALAMKDSTRQEQNRKRCRESGPEISQSTKKPSFLNQAPHQDPKNGLFVLTDIMAISPDKNNVTGRYAYYCPICHFNYVSHIKTAMIGQPYFIDLTFVKGSCKKVVKQKEIVDFFNEKSTSGLVSAVIIPSPTSVKRASFMRKCELHNTRPHAKYEQNRWKNDYYSYYASATRAANNTIKATIESNEKSLLHLDPMLALNPDIIQPELLGIEDTPTELGWADSEDLSLQQSKYLAKKARTTPVNPNRSIETPLFDLHDYVDEKAEPQNDKEGTAAIDFSDPILDHHFFSDEDVLVGEKEFAAMDNLGATISDTHTWDHFIEAACPQ